MSLPTGFEKNGADVKQAMLYNQTTQERVLNTIATISTTDSEGDPLNLGSSGGAGGGASVYSTAQGDFTIAVTDGAKTATVTGLPFSLTDDSVFMGSAKIITALGDSKDIPITNVTVSGNVITFGDLEDNFTATDTVVLSLVGPDKAYDSNLDSNKTIVQNTTPYHYTDSENLVTTSNIGVADGVAIDQGNEIDCRGFKVIYIWVNYIDNTSVGGQLQIMQKHILNGSDEYKGETSGDYIKTMVADNKIVYVFEVSNAVASIQVQTLASTVSASIGTVTIDITKGY